MEPLPLSFEAAAAAAVVVGKRPHEGADNTDHQPVKKSARTDGTTSTITECEFSSGDGVATGIQGLTSTTAPNTTVLLNKNNNDHGVVGKGGGEQSHQQHGQGLQRQPGLGAGGGQIVVPMKKMEYPFFHYRDFSHEPDPDPLTPLTPPGRVPNFPAKMHSILSRPELADVVRWMPHGRSWRVLKPREFEIRVIPTYFEHAKFSSFIRQANGWGFRRITCGRDRNSYYHELFVRGLPHLCKKMKRPGVAANNPNKKKKKTLTQPDEEPDFYKISELHPTPEKAEDESILLPCTLQGGPKARMPIYSGSICVIPPPPPSTLVIPTTTTTTTAKTKNKKAKKNDDEEQLIKDSGGGTGEVINHNLAFLAELEMPPPAPVYCGHHHHQGRPGACGGSVTSSCSTNVSSSAGGPNSQLYQMTPADQQTISFFQQSLDASSNQTIKKDGGYYNPTTTTTLGLPSTAENSPAAVVAQSQPILAMMEPTPFSPMANVLKTTTPTAMPPQQQQPQPQPQPSPPQAQQPPVQLVSGMAPPPVPPLAAPAPACNNTEMSALQAANQLAFSEGSSTDHAAMSPHYQAGFAAAAALGQEQWKSIFTALGQSMQQFAVPNPAM